MNGLKFALGGVIVLQALATVSAIVGRHVQHKRDPEQYPNSRAQNAVTVIVGAYVVLTCYAALQALP